MENHKIHIIKFVRIKIKWFTLRETTFKRISDISVHSVEVRGQRDVIFNRHLGNNCQPQNSIFSENILQELRPNKDNFEQ